MERNGESRVEADMAGLTKEEMLTLAAQVKALMRTLDRAEAAFIALERRVAELERSKRE